MISSPLRSFFVKVLVASLVTRTFADMSGNDNNNTTGFGIMTIEPSSSSSDRSYYPQASSVAPLITVPSSTLGVSTSTEIPSFDANLPLIASETSVITYQTISFQSQVEL